MRKKLWSSKVADDKFSLWIRNRDKKCVNCGRTSYLTCSHYWNRNMSSVRYDPINCDTLCWLPCHATWEKQKQGAYMIMKLKQLGKQGYKELMQKAHKTMKREDAIRELMSWLR